MQQTEYEQKDCVRLKDGLRALNEAGVDITYTIFLDRITKHKVIATKFGGRDWWIPNTEITRIIEEQAS